VSGGSEPSYSFPASSAPRRLSVCSNAAMPPPQSSPAATLTASFARRLFSWIASSTFSSLRSMSRALARFSACRARAFCSSSRAASCMACMRSRFDLRRASRMLTARSCSACSASIALWRWYAISAANFCRCSDSSSALGFLACMRTLSSKILCIEASYGALTLLVALVSITARLGFVSTVSVRPRVPRLLAWSSLLSPSRLIFSMYTRRAATPFSSVMMEFAVRLSSAMPSLLSVGCSLVKLLIIASGELLSTKRSKSGWRLHLDRSSPKA